MAVTQLLTNSRGIALITTLLIMSALTTLIAAGAVTSGIALQVTGSLKRGNQAFYAAEAGLAHALSVLETPLSLDAVLVGTDATANTSDDGILSFGTSVDFNAGAYIATYEVKVTDNDDGDSNLFADTDDQVIITSTGLQGDAERQVEAVVARFAPFSFSLFGDDWLHLQGGVSVDGYNSDDGPYPNGPGDTADVGSNGDRTYAEPG